MLADKKTMQKALEKLPAELREIVLLWLDRLHETGGACSMQEPDLSVLLRLVGTSDFAARVLLRDWEWFTASLNECELSVPPSAARLRQFIEEFASNSTDLSASKTKLRRFRNRQLVHILWRSIEGSANLQESLSSLSSLADGLIEAAVVCSDGLLTPRFGKAKNADGDDIPLVVLAMGKLGGRELNFSSDIDIIFLYPEEGETDGPRILSAHEYFTRRSRQVA